MTPLNVADRVAFALAASPLDADTLCHALVAGRHEIVSALDLLRSGGIVFPTGIPARDPWALTRYGLDLVEAAMKHP